VFFCGGTLKKKIYSEHRGGDSRNQKKKRVSRGEKGGFLGREGLDPENRGAGKAV